mgnify:FL=1|jgi:hypothetical protein
MNILSYCRPVIAATLLPVWTHSLAAGPLDAFRDVNRLVVVSLPQGPAAENVAAAWCLHRVKIDERDLKIIDASEGAQRVAAGVRLNPEHIIAVRQHFKLAAGEPRPVFILVGKDGGEKARQVGTLDLETWFALIDHMPTRRQEIQNQQKKSD